jgi:hypothetical protein
MSDDFELLMLSAMYENGGNTVHRLLDGHPELFVYPFESQLGTGHVADRLTSLFPVKYRWPVFDLAASAADHYRSIIDEECRVRARTPHVSKFRHVAFDFDDDARGHAFEELVAGRPRSRASNVAAFFEATFRAWRNHRASGRERVYVGYSPIVVVDTEKILEDFPRAHLIHVVRNPWSAWAETLKRPVPLSLADYMLGWTVCQHAALLHREQYPGRVHVLRFEDVVEAPRAALEPILAPFGLASSPSLDRCSWNGEPLQEVAPWGTIRDPSPEANRLAAAGLSPELREDVRRRARPYLHELGYEGF